MAPPFTSKSGNPPLTVDAVAGLVYAAGLRGEPAAVAVAVTTPESGRDATIRVYNEATGDDSYGLWQINMLDLPQGPHLGPARRVQFGIQTDGDLLKPEVNARAMYIVSGGGTNFGPWSTFKAGKHRPYLDDARQAVAAVEARGGNPDPGTAGPAVPVDLGRSGDVTWGLPAAIDPTVDRPRSADWGPGFFIRGQSALRTLVADTMTGGSVDLGVDTVAEMTIEMSAPDTAAVWAVAEELALDTPVDWWDLLLQVVGCEWGEGPGMSYRYTARCRAAGPEGMRRRSGNITREWTAMSPSEVLEALAAENGLRYVAEGSNRRDLIVRKGPDDGTAQMPTSGNADTESDWDLGQRLAKEEGYWFFETAGTLYFARPSWLVTRMPRFDVNARGELRGIDDFARGNNGTVGVPTASLARDDDLTPGLPPRQLTVRLPRDRGEQVRPGMVADFAGLPFFDGSYLVAKVSFPFDGGLDPAVIDLVDPQDPVPVPPADDAGDTPRSTAGPVGGGGASALDFVTIALRQIGDRYAYGAQVTIGDPDPTSFDCSGLVNWALGQVGVTFPRQSEADIAAIDTAGLTRSVDACTRIRGALLWHQGHVAISLGDGAHTVEAMGPQYGVVQGNIGSRFTRGGLIPGLVYPPGS